MPVTHPPVIPHFIHQAQGHGSLVVHGDGKQTRDFVYIDDVVQALVAAANAPNINQRVINVGSGVETSISQLVEMIGQATEQTPHVLTISGQSGGTSRMCADLTLARDLLGWSPKVFLAEGLRRILTEDERFAVKVMP
jgi:UDP-glucose 4-epimerase